MTIRDPFLSLSFCGIRIHIPSYWKAWTDDQYEGYYKGCIRLRAFVNLSWTVTAILLFVNLDDTLLPTLISHLLFLFVSFFSFFVPTSRTFGIETSKTVIPTEYILSKTVIYRKGRNNDMKIATFHPTINTEKKKKKPHIEGFHRWFNQIISTIHPKVKT